MKIKDLIIEKYNTLLQNIKQHTNISIFPSLDSYDIYELIYYFNINFDNISDYEPKIKEIINTYNLNISDDIFKNIYPDIKSFLDWFKSLKGYETNAGNN